MRLAKSRTFGKLFPEVNIYGYMIYIYIELHILFGHYKCSVKTEMFLTNHQISHVERHMSKSIEPDGEIGRLLFLHTDFLCDVRESSWMFLDAQNHLDSCESDCFFFHFFHMDTRDRCHGGIWWSYSSHSRSGQVARVVELFQQHSAEDGTILKGFPSGFPSVFFVGVQF